jgi:hypothetical protein
MKNKYWMVLLLVLFIWGKIEASSYFGIRQGNTSFYNKPGLLQAVDIKTKDFNVLGLFYNNSEKRIWVLGSNIICHKFYEKEELRVYGTLFIGGGKNSLNDKLLVCAPGLYGAINKNGWLECGIGIGYRIVSNIGEGFDLRRGSGLEGFLAIRIVK